MDVVTLEKRGSSPAVLLGPASGKGLSVFSALSGNDRELSPLGRPPSTESASGTHLQRVQYSLLCVLGHLPSKGFVPVSFQLVSKMGSHLRNQCNLGLDRAGLMD